MNSFAWRGTYDSCSEPVTQLDYEAKQPCRYLRRLESFLGVVGNVVISLCISTDFLLDANEFSCKLRGNNVLVKKKRDISHQKASKREFSYME